MAERPSLFAEGGMKLRFEPDGRAAGFSVAREGKGLVVRYGRMTDAFRALGRLLGGDKADLAGFEETPRLDTLGIMVDVSRNAVLTVETPRRSSAA